MRKIKELFRIATATVTLAGLAVAGVATGQVTPDLVEEELAIGESMEVAKEVTTPEIPPVVDVCLLEDETGSFADDIANLKGGTTASDIYDTIVATAPGAQFAVAGFRDYPVGSFGSAGDWVYRLLSSMSPAKADWLAGIAALSAGGGNDIPEAQYDAIVAAGGPGPTDYPDSVGPQDDCGWRDPVANPGVQRVLVVTTDAPFHAPGVGKPHVNDQAATIAALNAQNIKVIGLKAPGAGGELDALVAAIGGSVQPLSSDGSNIGASILAGLAAVTTDVWWEIDPACDAGLNVTLDPAVHLGVSGGTTVNFTETISVDNDPALQGTTLECVVTFIANSYPDEGAVIGREVIRITVPDTTAPEAVCMETVNPAGKNVPKAPAKGGQGQNQDGFYQLFGSDNVGVASIVVKDNGSAFVSNPFADGDKIKLTQAPGITPSDNRPGPGVIVSHLKFKGDAIVVVTDTSGNVTEAACLVPPLPM